MQCMDSIQVLFGLIIELCKLITGGNIIPATLRLLSPEMRQKVVKLNKTLDEYRFLCEKQIDSSQKLVSFISETRAQISALEKDRQAIYNRNRHKKSETLNAEARNTTAKIKPLCKELFIAKAILEKIPRYEKLLETERKMENVVAMKHKESMNDDKYNHSA